MRVVGFGFGAPGTRAVWKVLTVLCISGFMACCDKDKPSSSQHGGAGGGAPVAGGGTASSGGGGRGAIAGGGLAAASGSAGNGELSGDGGGREGGIAGEANIGGAPTIDDASIVMLGLDQRPYTECESFTITSDYARDEDGIPLKPYKGALVYNPVMIAQAGLVWLACYSQTDDPPTKEWYRDHAIQAGRYLVGMAHDFDGAMFFSYDYDFHLHGSKTEIAVAPWYSGMAQGQVLSLFSRLGELTEESEWVEAAANTMLSFDRYKGKHTPWIMEVDDNDMLWIEEYADTPETRVLNGFMFAMFGLYDYWAWQKDEHAAELFLRSLYTLRHNVELFRNPGDISAYCLAHRVQNASYHQHHQDQLRAITRMTEDPYFASVADLFAADY